MALSEPHAVDEREIGSIGWHASTGEDVLARLSSDRQGLSADEAGRRLTEYGPNRLTRQQGPSAWAVLARQFASPLIYALLISAVVAFAFGDLADGAVVLGVVVLNALIGFVQEYRAGRAIQALAQLVSEPATVLRDERWTQVHAADLVPGDVVSIEAGARVAADLRVLQAHGLRVDESTLTGESLPVDKSAAPVGPAAELAERRSMLHGGTLVTTGSAVAAVVETGDRTELGRISGLLGGIEQTQTPLTLGIARLGSTITKIIGLVAVVLLGVALLRGFPVADAALAAITLAVAAIPEGLPAIVTIALAVGVQRMARRQAVVRELPAVETLGSTSVVCTDKTGTLTRNEMMVRRAWTPHGDEAEFDGVGYEAAGRMVVRGRAGPLRKLLVGAALANEARLDGADDRRTVLGDPTDGAMLVAAERGDVALDELFRTHPPHAVLPFDSERKYMASAPEPGTDGFTYFKGAPEVLLAHVDPTDADAAHAVLDAYAADGMRVLAVCRRYDADSGGLLLDGRRLELLGLVALIDPLRPEVVDAVDACHRAGVSVKMITGDHAATAAAIGRDLGIGGNGPPMTGAEIAELSDDELRDRVRTTDVFARVAPEHKLELVRALQAGGAVIAMTGDGVNDAPALRQADIGVAMGRAGTAAAKEAADIVLGDDNFATIRAAIEEGRRVYDNLVKALAFVLPTNVGEALIVLVAVLAFPVVGGSPVLPIEPVQILWINLVATVSLALPIAFEAQEPDSMRKPPRDPDEPLLSRFVVVRTVYVGALMAAVAIALFLVAVPVAPIAQAQTLAVTSVAFFQIFYLLMCRTLIAPVRSIGWASNRYVFAGIAVLLVLQTAVVHLPFLQAVFHTDDLSIGQWTLAAAAGAVVVPVVAVEKWWRQLRGDLARAQRPQ
ncbi:HAD-IC family P-type ATPase [Pseudonocardia sp. DSM 110487]|uniref:cation-translocating P-type ATPase n=1 Tax=Pseudonocardia sp. DSM 110487 TaxID=2865833 RepID=UPI001C6A0BD4|nr:HAD-IC family P-type ATPase [Pseudonocardia sp. DSM 110487]QYN34105.1 HAD-IC family P-type ATPase [Pseudonocardia sp. DSM 110487]